MPAIYKNYPTQPRRPPSLFERPKINARAPNLIPRYPLPFRELLFPAAAPLSSVRLGRAVCRRRPPRNLRAIRFARKSGPTTESRPPPAGPGEKAARGMIMRAVGAPGNKEINKAFSGRASRLRDARKNGRKVVFHLAASLAASRATGAAPSRVPGVGNFSGLMTESICAGR